MKYKGAWILVLLFLLLVGYLYLIENPREKKEAELKEKAEKLFDFSIDQGSEVELLSPKGHYLLHKSKENQWTVRNAEGAGGADVAADSSIAERILEELHRLKPDRVIDEKGVGAQPNLH